MCVLLPPLDKLVMCIFLCAPFMYFPSRPRAWVPKGVCTVPRSSPRPCLSLLRLASLHEGGGAESVTTQCTMGPLFPLLLLIFSDRPRWTAA